MFPLILLLQTTAAPTAQPISGVGAPGVTPPRIEAQITIDGALDEPVWSAAARLGGFSQYQPSDSRPAEERTEVLVWYGPDAIYFGIHAYDRDPSSIRATMADRDNLDREDSVTIYLDTFNDRRRAFFFAVNPLGAQQDGVYSEGQFNAGQQHGASEDKNPDYRYESKGRLTPDGYTAEMRIPFKSLRYPGGKSQTWGINIKRTIQRTGYQDTWTDAKRISSFLAQAGRLEGLHDLHRGVVTEVQPFVTGTNDGVRVSDTQFARGATDVNGGVNARLGFTNMSLDATIKPDFSQVESDAGLITINQRFALFYPEKRPFFLEGIELFSTPNQLVYTRQIVSPIGGAKVTGKFGPLGVAYLTAVDDTPTRNALFNVARIRTDLGQNSVAGVTYTDREQGATFNRVLAADARIVFAKLYYVLGQAGGSWTGADATTSSPIWTAEFDRTARHWGFNYKLNGIGQDFISSAGYVPRSDIVDGHLMNRLSYYGKPGALVEDVTTFFGPQRIWAYTDFGHESPIEGHDSINTTVTFRGGWQVQVSPTRDYVHFNPTDYSGYEIAATALRALATATDLTDHGGLATDLTDHGGLATDLTDHGGLATDLTGHGGLATNLTDHGGLATDFTDQLVPYDVPHGLDNEFGLTTSVTTPTWRRVNGKLEVVRGEVAIFPEASAGRQHQWTATLGVRPTPSIRLDLSAVRSVITRIRDDSEFASTTLPRLKIEYQPKRSLFFRMVTEYRSQQQAPLLDARTGEPLYIDGDVAGAQQFRGIRMDWLVSFEPTPGTAFYFGYGSALEEPGVAPATSDPGPRSSPIYPQNSGFRRASDAFFAKLAYQFRR